MIIDNFINWSRQECKYDKSWYITRMLIVGLVLLFGSIMIFSIVDFTTNEYWNKCHQLTNEYDHFTTKACIEFAEKHPDATGQDVVDYFTTGILEERLGQP